MSVESAVLGARCWSCVPPRTQFEIQTYILAVISGQSTDPSILVSLSRCLTCLSTQTLYELKSYFLASLAGLSTDPQDMVERSKCFICQVPEGMYLDIQTYALSLDPSGPGVTDPNQLQQLSKDFQGVNPSSLLQIQVYLLATIAGVSTDPTALAALVKCYVCIPHNIITAAAAQALDYAEIETGGGIGPGGGCVDVPAQQIPVIAGIYTDGVLTGISILLPQVCCSPQSVTIYEADDAIGTGAVAIASAPIADSHAGEINYVLPDYTFGAPPAKAWILVTQTCDGGTESGYSNAVEVAPSCGVATTVIEVTGAGEADANGFYVWSQAEYDSSGRFVYINPETDWFIEFTNGVGGVEAYLYNDAVAVMYHLLLGECFPCGEWSNGGGDLGADPVPTAAWAGDGYALAFAWADLVVTNGGARPSTDTIYAGAVFLNALETAGIRTKMIALNIVAPDSSIASRTPMIYNGGANSFWTEAGTPGALDLTVNGARPTNASYGQRVATNVRAVITAAGGSNGNVGLTEYLYTSSNEATSNFGVSQGAEWIWLHEWHNVAGAIIFFCPNQTTGDCRWVTASKTGFISASNETTSLARMYFANSTTAFSKVKETTTGPYANDVPAQELLAAGSQIVGVGYFTSTVRRSSFFALHKALTQAETQALYNAVQTLRTSLGGGYV